MKKIIATILCLCLTQSVFALRQMPYIYRHTQTTGYKKTILRSALFMSLLSRANGLNTDLTVENYELYMWCLLCAIGVGVIYWVCKPRNIILFAPPPTPNELGHVAVNIDYENFHRQYNSNLLISNIYMLYRVQDEYAHYH